MDPEINSQGGHDWITKTSVKFYRYRTLFKRHWWIPLLTVSVGLSIEAFLLWQKSDLYRSHGQLMVRGELRIEQGQQYVEAADGFYGTQLSLLENPEIHRRATQRVELEAPHLSGEVEVSASLIPRSSIFQVTGTGEDPEYTRKFVEAMMEEFIAFKRDQRRDTTDTTMMEIKEELAQIGRQRDKHETELQAFVEKNNMAFWEEQGKTAAHFLNDLKTQQANLITEKHRLENLSSDQLLAQPGSSAPRATAVNPDMAQQVPPESRDSAPMTSDLNAQYLEASQQLIQKRAELQERSKVWKPKHPGIVAINDDIERIERLIGSIRSLNKEGTQARLASIVAELSSLGMSIKNWETRVLEASRKDAEYQRLRNAVARDQDNYDSLMKSITGLDIGSGLSQESLGISQHATPAYEVPRGVFAHLATGILGGLALGIIVLGVMDKADDRVSSSSEMLDQFSEPILGQIPNVENSRTDGGLPLLQREDQRFMYAEAFRSLRSSLVFMPGQTELRSVIITSAIPNEGKSTIASNLAVTMALAGARVLLVDADLRRGDLAALYDVDGRFGLSSILRGEVTWRSVVQETKHSTLSLIPRGPVTNQSGELLLVPAMDKMLGEFRDAYDLTIFNTSPVLATDDAATLAPNFDGTLVVVRAGFTSARLTRTALNALYQRQVNVLGLILNCVDADMPDYYYYRYPKYYAA